MSSHSPMPAIGATPRDDPVRRGLADPEVARRLMMLVRAALGRFPAEATFAQRAGEAEDMFQEVSKQAIASASLFTHAAATAFGPILVRHESEVPETESSCGLEKGLCGIIDGGAARACSMALTNVEAHFHKRTTEIYYVLDGQGVVQLNGEEHRVRKGSFMHIPPGVVHSFTGQAKVLIIGVPAISTDDDMFYPASPAAVAAETA